MRKKRKKLRSCVELTFKLVGMEGTKEVYRVVKPNTNWWTKRSQFIEGYFTFSNFGGEYMSVWKTYCKPTGMKPASMQNFQEV